MEHSQVYSCPSKVLIMGGYAILSEDCVGLSVGLGEKFYAYAVDENTKEEGQNLNEKKILFYSKQISSHWHYSISPNSNTLSDKSENPNPFLESVVRVLIEDEINISKLSQSTSVFIYHDSRFYSSDSQLQNQQPNKFKSFDKENLHKTGLGSSACVLVSTMGTLLKHLGVYSERKLHYLSQKANFIAQKKIGSGFDVATSVFGSQVYRRFPPNIFSAQGIEHNWEKFNRFSIPTCLKVVMVDLCIGSDTRVMAGSIKKYLDSHEEEAKNFYSESNSCANQLQQIFLESNNNIDKLTELKGDIQAINTKYRQIFKQIGVLASVDTEPEVLTSILDLIIQAFSNIYYAVCPGAGGYDAICLLADNSLDLNSIQQFLNSLQQKYPSIASMSANEISVSLEGFRELNDQEKYKFMSSIL